MQQKTLTEQHEATQGALRRTEAYVEIRVENEDGRDLLLEGKTMYDATGRANTVDKQ